MTIEEPLDPMTTRRLLSQQAIDESQVRATRYYEQVARCQAEKAELELSFVKDQAGVPEMNIASADATRRRAQNALRPSVFWGARLEVEADYYTTTYGGMSVRGDSPEIAMENFDRAWAFGDRDNFVDTDDDDEYATA